MIVETHPFKEAFVKGAATGFVVCSDLPATRDQAPRRIFAEIYGGVNCYHIFEDRAETERQRERSAAGSPRGEDLSVREVRVENIRDYQSLAGVKTIFLVDRDGRATQSLRVGDMPLSVRTNPPFPGTLPARLRTGHRLPTSKISASTRAAEAAVPAEPHPRVRRPMRLQIDPPSAAAENRPAVSPDADPATASLPRGIVVRLWRRFLRWF